MSAEFQVLSEVEPPSPLVSVVMSSRDGESTLTEAVMSIREQQDVDLELVLINNGSRDGTGALVREHAKADSRVFEVHRGEGISAVESFRDGILRCRGAFIVLAADDDIWNATYLSSLASALMASPDAILAFGRINIIDESGATVEMVAPPASMPLTLVPVLAEGTHKAARTRLRGLVYKRVAGGALNLTPNLFYAMYRAAPLVNLAGDEWDPRIHDRMLLAPISISSGWVYVERALASRLRSSVPHHVRRRVSGSERTDLGRLWPSQFRDLIRLIRQEPRADVRLFVLFPVLVEHVTLRIAQSLWRKFGRSRSASVAVMDTLT